LDSSDEELFQSSSYAPGQPPKVWIYYRQHQQNVTTRNMYFQSGVMKTRWRAWRM